MKISFSSLGAQVVGFSKKAKLDESLDCLRHKFPTCTLKTLGNTSSSKRNNRVTQMPTHML